GHSAYPRLIDFEKMRAIADTVGATLMVDMAHFAGLVAGKGLTGVQNPIPYADIVTSTTHKTMRGPRGGMVLCKDYLKPYVDKGCPYVLGGPLPHVMAAKAIAFQEALEPEFAQYASQVVKNAQAMAKGFMDEGAKLFTDGTDNHLIVVDVEKSFGLNGKQAEHALVQAGVIVNRNTVPNDPNGAWFTSGIRLGSPALTTRGMKEAEMEQVGSLICTLLRSANGTTKNESEVEGSVLAKVCSEIDELLKSFPLYPEIDVEQMANIS
ncbi:MAG: aminotransferase class I/II-fold pyridoxal phosphate-dependent enzyme, partial [Simkaniaceae bacterium]|nr:aminotransferase class I/II-fold pyridoxal phosphate-dependent enzyme [Simkaniaceae bacterium]